MISINTLRAGERCISQTDPTGFTIRGVAYRTGDIMQPGKTKVSTAGMTEAILKALDRLAA